MAPAPIEAKGLTGPWVGVSGALSDCLGVQHLHLHLKREFRLTVGFTEPQASGEPAMTIHRYDGPDSEFHLRIGSGNCEVLPMGECR